MKCTSLVTLLTLSLVVSFSATGCRKNVQKTTPLPGRQAGTPGDIPTGPKTDIASIPNIPIDTTPRNPVIPTAIPDTGLPPAGGDFTGWNEDRETFRSDTVYFDFDSSTVKSGELPKLERVASHMKSNPGKAVRVEGHCDERGTEEYNRALGERRALAIREALVRLGLDGAMIPTISFGEDRPTDSGHDDAAWSKNRRGEFILLTKP